MSVFGCKNDNQSASHELSHTEAIVIDKSTAEILSSILSKAPIDSMNTTYSYGDEKYTTYFDYLYDLPMDIVTDGTIGYAADSGLADEISILHVNSEDDVPKVKKALEDRIESRINVFSGYKPAEVAKLGNAQVVVNGSYVFLIVCDNVDEVKNSINTILK